MADSDQLARWLALREPADTAARSGSLVELVSRELPKNRPISVMDLATGTGSNIRYLAPRLPGPQHWLAIDHDPDLLTALSDRMKTWATSRGAQVRHEGAVCTIEGPGLECRVETACLDLGAGDRTWEHLSKRFKGRDLVTASAILDLVSETWLRQLAGQCYAAGAAVLFALTYNGSSACLPSDALDEAVRSMLNRHQQTDKGLGGVAAGPVAATLAQQCLAAAGYHTQAAASAWTLQGDQAELQQQLVSGWFQAASELEPGMTSSLKAWLARRSAHIAAGRSRMTVGHVDVAGWRRDPYEAVRPVELVP